MISSKKIFNFMLSDICLGCSTIQTNHIKHYLNVGGNFLDTAPVYLNGESEKTIGKFGHRNEFVISTKVGLDPYAPGLSSKNILQSVESSLKRLKTDYIDILWVHVWDGTLDFAQVFYDLMQSGKVLAIGACNTPAWVVAMYRDFFKFIQIEYNLNNRTAELELIPMANKLNIKIIARSIFDKGQVFKALPFQDIDLLTLQWIKSKNIIPIIRTNNKINLYKNIDNFYNSIPTEHFNILDKATKHDINIQPYNFINSYTVQKILKSIK